SPRPGPARSPPGPDATPFGPRDSPAATHARDARPAGPRTREAGAPPSRRLQALDPDAHARRSPRRIPRSRSRRTGPRTSPSTFGRSRRPWRPGHRARDPPRGRGGPRTASPWPRELPGLIQEPPDALGEVGRETVLAVPEPG